MFLLFSLLLFADQQNKVFEVGNDASITLKNVSGDVEVDRGTGGEIVVEWESDDDRIEVITSQKGNHVDIEVEYPKRVRNAGSVHFKVRVPENTRCSLHSVSGDVKARDISGSGNLETVSGDVVASNIFGDWDLNTVSGDIDLSQAEGEFRLEAVSGRITADQVSADELRASCVSGSISIEAGTLDGIYELETTSGSITVSHNTSSSYRGRFETFSGNIRLPNGGDFDLRKEKYTNSQSARGEYKGAKGSLEAETLSGSITIKEN